MKRRLDLALALGPFAAILFLDEPDDRASTVQSRSALWEEVAASPRTTASPSS
jgi:ABC-type multidrug transport system ATPase subunit